MVTFRILVYASFRIPSFSMEPTLLAGDFILVNKSVFGPRIDFMGSRNQGWAIRLKGQRSIERNDILVFNDPYFRSSKIVQNWNASHYVKRCVGLPGDQLYIRNGAYFVNGRPAMIEGQMNVDSTQYLSIPMEYRVAEMFKELGWTIDNFGPIYVPQRGDVVSLDTLNISLYRPLIEYETGKELTIAGEGFLLDGQLCRSYLFQRDYYFMAGDRVVDSRDSRYWGLLPEDHIVGVVAYIWKSKDPVTGAYRFDRFFKPVR